MTPQNAYLFMGGHVSLFFAWNAYLAHNLDFKYFSFTKWTKIRYFVKKVLFLGKIP